MAGLSHACTYTDVDKRRALEMPRGVLVPSGTSRGMKVPYTLADAFIPRRLPTSVRGRIACGASAEAPIRKPILDSAQSVCMLLQTSSYMSTQHALTW
jgi:hypothetical protein